MDAVGLVVNVGQGDLRNGDALVGGQFLDAVVALEVFLVAVDFDGKLIVPFGEGVEVVAAETTAEEATGHAGPDEEGDAVGAAPGPCGLSRRPADADAVAPGRFYLDGKAELGAAGDERRQPVRGGVFVGLLQALGAPVGAAVGVDLTGLFGCVECFDNRADRLVGIVAVQDVEVDAVNFETREAVVEIGLDVVGRDPFAVLAVVCAFAEDDDLVAQAAFVNPLADGAFIVAAAIAVGGVEAVAAGRVEGVEHGVGVFEGLGVYPHRSQHEAGDGLVDAGDVGIEHGRYS